MGKGYAATGQAGACLHTMSVLQAYQADLLKEMDERKALSCDVIMELSRTADLALHATKETARAIWVVYGSHGGSGKASVVHPV